jgi:hypothetical protein
MIIIRALESRTLPSHLSMVRLYQQVIVVGKEFDYMDYYKSFGNLIQQKVNEGLLLKEGCLSMKEGGIITHTTSPLP